MGPSNCINDISTIRMWLIRLKLTVSPLATWFRPGEIGLIGRPCTHKSLGGKQGKPGGLVVQTPGAKVDPASREYLTSQAIRGIWIVGHGCSPDKRYRRIRTCLSGEVESSSSLIRRQASDVRYPGGWNVGG